MSSPSVPAEGDNHDANTDDGDDTDDDIVILETSSTPKPKKPPSGLLEVTKEESDANLNMLLECCDDAAVGDSSQTATAGTSSSGSTAMQAGHPAEMVHTTTQTVAGQVKQEEDSHGPAEMKGRAEDPRSGTEQRSDFGGHSLKQREIKQERSDDNQRETEKQQALQNGGAQIKSDERAGPSSANACGENYVSHHFSSIAEVEKQQEQLLEMMQETAQERDSLKDLVQKLTSELQDAHRRLQEVSCNGARDKYFHKACQTEESEEHYYKNLFEKAKQKVNDLIKDKETLIAAVETKADVTTAKNDEKEIDEILLRVGCLVEELDKRNEERDELRSQVSVPVFVESL